MEGGVVFSFASQNARLGKPGAAGFPALTIGVRISRAWSAWLVDTNRQTGLSNIIVCRQLARLDATPARTAAGNGFNAAIAAVAEMANAAAV